MDRQQYLQQIYSYRVRLSKQDKSVVPLLASLEEYAAQTQDNYLIAEALASRAFEALYINADYAKAVDIATQALNLAGDDNVDFCSRLHLLVGRAFIYLSNFQEARIHLYKTIDLAEQLEQKNYNRLITLSEVYHMLGMVNSMLKLPVSRTREYLEKGLHFATLADNRTLRSVCTLGLGNSYIDEGKLEEAMKYYELALVDTRDDEYHNKASIYSNIGYCLIELNRYKEAEEKILISLAIREEYCTKDDVAISLLLLSNIHIKNEELEKAEDVLQRAYSSFHTSGNKQNMLIVIEKMIALYKQIGNAEKVIEYYDKLVALQGQVNDLVNKNQLAEMEAKFSTAQKEKEAALLRQKNAEIEEYARQLELSNSELRQFAHVASHDLKEPLRMISSYIGLLQRKLADKLDEEEKQFLTFAIDGSHRMEALINDLLALSKVNALSKQEQVDLNHVLADVLKNFQVEIDEGKVDITYDKLPTIKADRIYMVQLFQNLISNGLKYNINHPKKIEITYQQLPTFIQLIVTDNGIGIEEKYKSQIFDLFKRLHTRKEYSGSGIGLSICKKIVEQLKGTIAVESEPAKGTSFLINLPVQLVIES
jgi:signal transduction histidine kinase